MTCPQISSHRPCGRKKVNLQGDKKWHMSDSTDVFPATVSFSTDGATGNSVTVPANGSASVTVHITMTAMNKWIMRNNYPPELIWKDSSMQKSGGNLRRRARHPAFHPLLGYYGNWTTPSMFDVGSYAEYQADDEIRTPYLGSAYTNCFGVTYSGQTGVYAFGGNPIVPDDHYIPERNAFNNQRGDTPHLDLLLQHPQCSRRTLPAPEQH